MLNLDPPTMCVTVQDLPLRGLLLLLLLLVGALPILADQNVPADSDNTTPVNNSFSFIVWGHPRGLIDGVPPLHFEEVLEKIKTLKVDALFVTGDVVNGGASDNKSYDPSLVHKDWIRFKSATEALGIPVHISPGNHDANNVETQEIFLKYNRAVPYAITHKNIRFLILDSVGIDLRMKQGLTCPLRNKEYWPLVNGRPIESHIKCWGILGAEFDDEQVEFIRNELDQQKDAEHIFLFMHHTHPWATEDGWWWKKIHPLLIGTNTRAVFSGDPFDRKFGYLFQDNIKYLQSTSLAGVPPSYFPNSRQKKKYWARYNELDNILYVVVNGDKPEDVTYQLLTIGAFVSNVGNWRYWQEVPKTYNWSQNFPEYFYSKFHRFRALVSLFVILAAVFFLIGLGAALFWHRRNRA